MRNCEDCLHFCPADNENTAYCKVHRWWPDLRGCDEFWPKSGAKCETCRFGTMNRKNEGMITCHRAFQIDDDPVFYADWFCEMWREK